MDVEAKKNFDQSEGQSVRPGKKANSQGNKKGKKIGHKYDRDGRATTKRGTNDVSWYIKHPQILKDAFSLPFSEVLGLPYKVLRNDTDEASHYVPGIITLGWDAVPGIARTAEDPINVAALNLYSFVRHRNSGSANYDPADLMLMVLAMDSAYTTLFHLRRIYQVARVYSTKNRYLGRALLSALGADPDSILSNLANFRARLNVLTTQLATIAVPSDFDFIRRHVSLSGALYADSADIQKAQLYVFKPMSYLRYVETDGAGYLRRSGFPTYQNGYATADQLINILDSQVSALVTSEDIGIMSGDIIKAYEGKIYTLPLMSEDEAMIPIYDEEVLSQIENSTIYTCMFTNGASNITQDPSQGILKCNPQMGYDSQGVFKLLLNSRYPTPSPEAVCVATRLSSYVNGTVTEGTPANSGIIAEYNNDFVSDLVGHVTLDSAGSEVISSACIWKFVPDEDGNPVITPNYFTSVTPLHVEADSVEGRVKTYKSWADKADLANFDWHPIQYSTTRYWVDGVPGSSADTYTLFKDLDNYTVLPPAALAMMHQAALCGLFGIPFYGISGM